MAKPPGNENGEAEIARYVREGMTAEEAMRYLRGVRDAGHEHYRAHNFHENGDRRRPWTATDHAKQAIREATNSALMARNAETVGFLTPANPERHHRIADAVGTALLGQLVFSPAFDVAHGSPVLAADNGIPIEQPKAVDQLDDRPGERLLDEKRPDRAQAHFDSLSPEKQARVLENRRQRAEEQAQTLEQNRGLEL